MPTEPIDKGMSDIEYWNKLHTKIGLLWWKDMFKLDDNKVGKHGTWIIACDPKVGKGMRICHWQGDCDNCRFAKAYEEEVKEKEAE